MKLLPASIALLTLILPAAGQGKGGAGNMPTKWEVEVPQAIDDGIPLKPTAKPAPLSFKVIRSQTKRVNVVEAPEMPGLPPITGAINVTVQMVEDPGLQGSPEPLPALKVDDPAVVARMAELQGKYQGTTLVFVSATVYDHKRTLLRIHTSGGTGSEVTAWSNLDFNQFSGFSTYRVKDGIDGTLYDYGILMGLGNEDTSALSEINSQSGTKNKAPKIPKIPDLAKGGPAFVVVGGKEGSPAMATLEQIHDLYRKDGKRMETAFHSREKARAKRKAYLLANPPKLKDVKISFWKWDPHTAASFGKPTVNKSR